MLPLEPSEFFVLQLTVFCIFYTLLRSQCFIRAPPDAVYFGCIMSHTGGHTTCLCATIFNETGNISLSHAAGVCYLYRRFQTGPLWRCKMEYKPTFT